MKERLRELDKLESYLKENGIKYERVDKKGDAMFTEWHQICVPVADPRERDWDAVCHPYSYGWEEGLLEIMGSIVPSNVTDGVIGNLTSDDVINLLKSEEVV